MKWFAGILTVALFLVYNGAIALKLKDPALVLVILIGLVLMLADLIQSLRSKGD